MSSKERHEKRQHLPPAVDAFTLWQGVDIVCDNGKPILEHNASPRLVERLGISTDTAASGYPGSRRGKQINVEALKAMHENWQGVLDGLVWVRNRHFQDNPPPQTTLAQAIELCRIVAAIPAYCTTRARKPFSLQGSLPAVIGDMYKANRGLLTAFEIMERRGVDNNTPITGKFLYEYVETHNLFLGADGQACAAPEHMIVAASDALLQGRGGNAPDSKLSQYIPDFEQLQECTRVYTETSVCSRNFYLLCRELWKEIEEDTNPSRKALALMYSLYSVGERRLLDFANSIQIEANRSLGRDTSHVPVLTLDKFRERLGGEFSQLMSRVETILGL